MDFANTQAPDPEWLARAESEPPLNPDIDIVDAHMHFWQRPGNRYFVEEFAADAKSSGHQIEATVYIECHSMYRARGPRHLACVGETEFAVGMAAIGASESVTDTRVAAAIVGHADVLDPKRLAEVLDAQIDAGNGRLAGVRYGAKWDSDPAVRGKASAPRPGIYLEPEFVSGLEKVAARGLTFDASVFHPQIPDVAELAHRVPDATIVLIHTGSPVGHASYSGSPTEVHNEWRASMRRLAQCPNVVIKLGGLLMSLAAFDPYAMERPPSSEELARLWAPYLESSLELFGPDRCMAASNFPVEKAGLPYGTIWNTYGRLLAPCSDSERRAVLAETAKRVYQVKCQN